MHVSVICDYIKILVLYTHTQVYTKEKASFSCYRISLLPQTLAYLT